MSIDRLVVRLCAGPAGGCLRQARPVGGGAAGSCRACRGFRHLVPGGNRQRQRALREGRPGGLSYRSDARLAFCLVGWRRVLQPLLQFLPTQSQRCLLGVLASLRNAQRGSGPGGGLLPCSAACRSARGLPSPRAPAALLPLALPPMPLPALCPSRPSQPPSRPTPSGRRQPLTQPPWRRPSRHPPRPPPPPRRRRSACPLQARSSQPSLRAPPARPLDTCPCRRAAPLRPSRRRSAGSCVPCRVPLRWLTTRVSTTRCGGS